MLSIDICRGMQSADDILHTAAQQAQIRITLIGTKADAIYKVSDNYDMITSNIDRIPFGLYDVIYQIFYALYDG